jgi:hypothetical protein
MAGKLHLDVPPLGKSTANNLFIRGHAEQHRHCFIHGQIGNPWIIPAPGAQGSDREWYVIRQSRPQIAKDPGVPGAFVLSCVEINLKAHDAGQRETLQ